MSTRFRHRKPNPRLQQFTIFPFSPKKIIILSSILIIGSATIYYYYKNNISKETKPKDEDKQMINNDNDHTDNGYLLSASFSSQSIYEKKISKFESKKEKLISKNPRLRNEDDIKQDLYLKKKK
eukprot:214483_1